MNTARELEDTDRWSRASAAAAAAFDPEMLPDEATRIIGYLFLTAFKGEDEETIQDQLGKLIIGVQNCLPTLTGEFLGVVQPKKIVEH